MKKDSLFFRWRTISLFYISAAEIEIPSRVSYPIKDGHWSADALLPLCLITFSRRGSHLRMKNNSFQLLWKWLSKRDETDECWLWRKMVSHGVMLYLSKEMLDEDESVSMSKDQIRRQASVSGESNDDQVCCCYCFCYWCCCYCCHAVIIVVLCSFHVFSQKQTFVNAQNYDNNLSIATI